MSKGARKKRATRPWNNPDVFRDIGDLLATAGGPGDDLDLDGYEVQRVDSGRAEKNYICPECGNTIPPGEGHVVVWPDDDPDLRRHWHTHCWRLEVRRTVGTDRDEEFS